MSLYRLSVAGMAMAMALAGGCKKGEGHRGARLAGGDGTDKSTKAGAEPAKEPLRVATGDWPGWTVRDRHPERLVKEAASTSSSSGSSTRRRWRRSRPARSTPTDDLGDALVTGAPGRAARPSFITD